MEWQAIDLQSRSSDLVENCLCLRPLIRVISLSPVVQLSDYSGDEIMLPPRFAKYRRTLFVESRQYLFEPVNSDAIDVLFQCLWNV